MDIGVPLLELGEYDVSPLCDVILAQGGESQIGGHQYVLIRRFIEANATYWRHRSFVGRVSKVLARRIPRTRKSG